ncbi:MAG: hypothetical protein U1F33_14170 [Alphaproteobacteria bacterium]
MPLDKETAKALEKRLAALARDAGNPLPAETIRALAETLAGTLAALRETAETLGAMDEAPAMRPALADDTR